jgi:predicted PurR-regulated permease PerM
MGKTAAIIRFFRALIRKTLFFISSLISLVGLIILILIVIVFGLTLIEPLLGLSYRPWGPSLQKNLYKFSNSLSSYFFFKCVVAYLLALLVMFFTRKRKNR